MRKQGALTLAAFLLASVSPAAHAWFLIFPIPNLAKPPQLTKLIDALEQSEETKALAYVSEDKTFGSKNWVWGHYAGHVTQAEANRVALNRCQESLARAKAQKAGGKDLYDFGTKTCELYEFANKKVSPGAVEEQSSPPTTPSTSVAPGDENGGLTNKAVPPHFTTSPTGATVSGIGPKTAQNRPVAVQPGSVSTPPTAADTGETSPTGKLQSGEGSTVRRMRELNDLRKEGLITETEYNEKRRAILSEM